jgi:hypothetical protein
MRPTGRGVVVLLCLVVATGCGRIGYEPVGVTVSDAGDPDAAPPADAGPTDGTVGVDGDTDGGVLFAANVRLTDDAFRSAAPSIAVGGGRYMVAWSDDRGGVLDVITRVFDTRFSAVTAELRLTSTSASSEAPVPIWNGSGWGIFWLEIAATSATVWAAEISADGGTVTTAPRALTGATSAGGNVSVTFDGASYVIAWADQRFGGANVMLGRAPVGLAGSFVEQRLTTGAGNAYFPSVAWAGSDVGVFFNDDRHGNLEIYFAHATSDLVATGEMRITDTPGISAAPSGAWTGSSYVLTWNEGGVANDEVWFAKIDQTGVTTGSYDMGAPASTLFPTLAYGAGLAMLVWGDDREAARQVYGGAVDVGSPEAPPHVRVSDGPPDMPAGFPWVATDADGFAIVWEDTRDGNSEIYGTRFVP